VNVLIDHIGLSNLFGKALFLGSVNKSTYLQNLAHIAMIFLAVVAVIGIYYWFKSLRQFSENLMLSRKGILENKRASRIQALRHILELMEDCRGERHLLEESIAADPKYNVLKASETDENKLDKLARSYDKLGALVKHGVAPIEFVMDFYSRPLVKGWQYLEPMISAERRKREQPGHMLKFQILAAGALEYRRRVYPSERSFDIPKEVMDGWKTWSQETQN